MLTWRAEERTGGTAPTHLFQSGGRGTALRPGGSKDVHCPAGTEQSCDVAGKRAWLPAVHPLDQTGGTDQGRGNLL